LSQVLVKIVNEAMKVMKIITLIIKILTTPISTVISENLVVIQVTKK